MRYENEYCKIMTNGNGLFRLETRGRRGEWEAKSEHEDLDWEIKQFEDYTRVASSKWEVVEDDKKESTDIECPHCDGVMDGSWPGAQDWKFCGWCGLPLGKGV